jgi:hypothetical protein
MWATQPYRDAVAIQRLVAKDAMNEECDPKTRCLLARAYKELEELKLRLKMKPAPKPIDTTKIPQKQKRSQSAGSALFVEL